MNNFKRILAMLLAVVLTFGLVACGGSEPAATEAPKAEAPKTDAPAATEAPKEEKKDVTPITDLVLPKLPSAELTTFNIVNTETANDRNLLINMVEGLCDNDNKGQLIPAVATEWGTEDNGLTWTFKLRDNAVWVDVNGNEKAPVVAADFATGMEWILNFHKNSSFNTANLTTNVKGAQEYYDYTKGLDEAEALALTWGEGSKFAEMVGIETPDDHTVIYTCTSEIPYFASLTTTSSLYPMAQGMIDELGIENVNSMTNETMWCNGPYTTKVFVAGNETVLEKNPLYWDTDAILFNSVTFKIVESNEVAYMLYENGEVDYVSLGESQVTAIYNDPNHKFHDYLVEALPAKISSQFHFNYNKNLPDGSKDVQWNTAVANEAFRKAFYYGVDMTAYYGRFNPIEPMNCTNDFYSRIGLCYTSDGEDYVELVRKNLGMDEASDSKIAHLDAAKAEQYKQQAIEELTAQGVTFPIQMYHWISNSQADVDNALVLKQCIEESLGSDFVQLNLPNYVSNYYAEVRDLSLQSFGIFGYGGTYMDPSTYLRHELYDNSAWFTNKYSHIIDLPADNEVAQILAEYTRLYDEAMAITDDNDKRLEAFAVAEAYLLDHVITVPAYISNSWCLTRIDLNTKMYSMLNGSDEKMKNWETNVDGYTREALELTK